MDLAHESLFVPDACELPTAQRPLRVAEFQDLFASSLYEVRRPAATRLDLVLDADPAVERIARDLAARESECCSFFTFSFSTVAGPGPDGPATRPGEPSSAHVLNAVDVLEMEITVPETYVEVLDGVERLAASSMRSGEPG
ncbi:hypothetical protein [Phytoactinopolyspora halotolerans]|uniref:Uncharacterized protein n=1 Tax=Phytoactinopolyspora halotolerans TaxID=1981512 RepID=A0A6L9SH42_9ACTN|nr:hypothetical protein [Phytoactinopolyspora halotolerans]NEE03938.1 hypothetical protein [Phytoactinopolyspora halotolerans]